MKDNQLESWFERFFPVEQDRSVWRMVLFVFTISMVIQVFVMVLEVKTEIHPLSAAGVFAVLGALWIWNLSEKTHQVPIQEDIIEFKETSTISKEIAERQRKYYAAGRR